jgi:hypothetical protein
MMHLAVVASMKKGLEQFIYREIRALAANGATIRVCTILRPSGASTVGTWRQCC